MFGPLPWQEDSLLEEKLTEIRATAAETRRSRLYQTGGRRKQRERGYWCLCIRKPRLLAGGRNG